MDSIKSHSAAVRALRGDVENLLHQIRQMREMFPDGDGTITEAIESAEDTLAGTEAFQKDPRIVIDRTGGCFQDVYGDTDAITILSLEFEDIQGEDPEFILTSPSSEPVYVSAWSPEYTPDIVQHYFGLHTLRAEVDEAGADEALLDDLVVEVAQACSLDALNSLADAQAQEDHIALRERVASEINNKGRDAQLMFLMRELPVEDIRTRIQSLLD